MAEERSGGGDIDVTLALMWKYDLPGRRRGPRPKIALDAIVATAVRIADEQGLAAVSMRSVATELGVGTMSLYRYVPGKDELLDLMLEEVSGNDVEVTGDWRSDLTAIGRGMWRLYTTHRWLPMVDQTRPLLGPNAVRGLEVAMGALDGLGLSDQERVAVVVNLDQLAAGLARTRTCAIEAEQRSGVSNEEFWQAQAPVLEAAMESGDYPHMSALSEDAFGMGWDETFELGLACFVEGVAALVAARRGA